MCGDDAHLIPYRVQPMQRTETQIPIFVDEKTWVTWPLTNLLDPQCVPGGVTGQQHPSRGSVGEDPDAARGVPGEIDKHHRPVAEEIVAALECRNRRAVEVEGTGLSAAQCVTDTRHRRHRGLGDPVELAAVYPQWQRGQIEQSADVVPMQVGRKREIE